MALYCQWPANIAASQYHNPPFDTDNHHIFGRSHSAVNCQLPLSEQDLLPKYKDFVDTEFQVFVAGFSLDIGKPGRIS